MNYSYESTLISENIKAFGYKRNLDRILCTLQGVFEFMFKNQVVKINDIKSWFKFESEEHKEYFHDKIDNLYREVNENEVIENEEEEEIAS